MAWTVPARAGIAMLQDPSNGACPTGTTCAVTVAALTAGSTLVAEVQYSNGASHTISSFNAGGTWVIPAGCHGFANILGIDCAYALSSTGGVTSITVTVSASLTTPWAFHVREYTSNGLTLDGTPTNNSSAACAACVTPSVAGVAGNDLLVAGAQFANTATSVNAPYGNLVIANGNAAVDNLNTSSGTGATINQTSGAATMNTIAFKEAASTAVGETRRRRVERLEE